jgi:hypothetical protein
MPEVLALRCTCGRMQGRAHDVGPRRGVRLLCYCRDCQTFAQFLERPELLDRHGGTEVFQMTPARVSFHAGHDQLACMRLGPKGLMRWYARCCNTPLGNTMSNPKLPFVGVISACWDPQLDADARNGLLGPLRARVNGPGHAAADGSRANIDLLPLWTIMRAIGVMLGGKLRGEHQPTPFFDLDSGAPTVSPRVLEPEEREALRARLPQP